VPGALRLVCAVLLTALAWVGSASAARVSVTLEEGAAPAVAGRLAADLGGRVVDAIPQLDAYLLDVPEARRALADETAVRSWQPARDNVLDWEFDDTYRHLLTHLTEIGAPEAWDVTRGDPDVVIAIVDTGVQLDHPDLVGRVVPGADVAEGDDDPSDTIGHGTLVAGLAGAAANNGIGIAGVCPSCMLLAVKAAKDGATSLSKFDSAQGIVWAADHGADVISLSFGSPFADEVEAQAVAYAQSKGALVVAAAGNRANDELHFPAAYEGVVAVAATEDPYRLWARSTFGSWVDVAAPGYRLLSTYASQYIVVTGTSFAAPIAAAAAGLALSAAPGLSAAAAADAVITGSLPLVDTTIRRVHLPRALRRALGGPIEPDPPPPLAFIPFSLSPNAFFVDDWGAPTAGRSFAAGARVFRIDSDVLVEQAAVTCSARVGRTRLPLQSATFQEGTAICVWRVPMRFARKTLRGRLVVDALGSRVLERFEARIRSKPRPGAPLSQRP
jgi:subtilisin family serine protease